MLQRTADPALKAASPAQDQAARPKVPRAAMAAAAALAVGALGAMWILSEPSIQSTDDAYIGADATHVAPRIKGFVSAVLVAENQSVRAGQMLMQIDPEEYAAHRARAEADLADARGAVLAARAALARQSSEEALASAQTAAAATSIRSAQANADHASADAARYQALLATGAVAARDAEAYRTGAVAGGQALARAQADLTVARRQGAVVNARRADLIAALDRAEAGEARAKATLDLAGQDLRHTAITAPIDGVVASRQLRVGDYAQPGTRALTLVPMQALYVTANFKETQTRHMHPGQRAQVHVDALGGGTVSGVVESIAPGSASTFALLPFEPGTGNFTKIVQRVPVRIRINPGQKGADVLRPGISVTAEVSVRE
ncbi:HlyD family secretion protein [Novosphingobium sp. KACC 22771]|uniref:HlyD family secretion protein n=1 Tax=Novosphingobium sp. KACC 22771 TaxID=3025670 RepID=UPI0023655C03|nr:HlyD family secretion protein [Novosphingobium sp. KACC 22771]WDF74974.1 HlyD family secretion protein [Novosphingobium sp. KACC 22771]